MLSNDKSYYTENENDIVRQISNFVNDKVQDYFKRKNVPVNQLAKIKERLIVCLEKLKSRLTDKSHFYGDKATAMDAKIFGLLAQMYYVPLTWPHDKLMKEEFKSLYQFCERIRDAFWPDWALVTKTGRSNTACEYFDFSTKK
uniref:Metaxin glutathione S-transferase domain-containing protein n=1 Tax=Romanomermis culicivorax TaxID=13658 RepID=A0A915J7D0_ROMCU